jgi:quercetin dioxygenase-like cupin family protein
LNTSSNTIERDTPTGAGPSKSDSSKSDSSKSDSSKSDSSTESQDRTNAVQHVLQAIGALEGWADYLPDLMRQTETKHGVVHSLEFAIPTAPTASKGDTMSEASENPTRSERPQSVTLNRYDLGGQFTKLRADAPIRKHGRDSFTLVRDPGMDVVLTVLNAGTHLSKHTAPGPISVLVLEGRIAFTAHGQRLELGPHCLVTLPTHVPHEVEALEESAILITIASPVAHTDAIGLAAEREAKS